MSAYTPENKNQESQEQGPAIDNRLIELVNKIVFDAVQQRASDILLEPLENQVQVRFRIDGILHKHLDCPKEIQENIITRIKVMSNLDISEHRLPQDGRFKTSLENKEVDFRVSVIPSTHGEKVALRVLDKSAATLEIEKLGFDNQLTEKLKKNLIKPFGMILVCGPTGSGKTTTLYAALKHIDSIEKNIITVEDPIEYQLFGINQVSVMEDIGLTFSAVLRSILRQDPNIILVGEIRDFETADTAIKAALTGHLLLSTLHTISSVGSIVRLVNMGVEPFLIASSCLLVVSQVLARRLCPKCKEEYKPDKEQVANFLSYGVELKSTDLLYRPKGCAACNNIGFKGRFALAESLEITSRIRELIIARASEKEIFNAAQEEGLVTLRQYGARFVKEGLTSIEEVIRVTSV